MPTQRGTIRQYWVAIRMMIVLTIGLGIIYPAIVLGIGQAFPAQANGSLVSIDGKIVGSSLIGQSFTDDKGNPIAIWFQSRPSAGDNDGTASGGSNLGPESSDLVTAIEDRRAAVSAFNGVSPADVPADAVTASASGLDPQISPAYARLQVARVAAARGIPKADVAKLVESKIQNGDLGYLSEPTVNVLELNLALSTLDK